MSVDIAEAPADFLADIDSLSVAEGVSLDDILDKALRAEHRLRRLFAEDAPPSDPYIGLIDLFNTPPEARRTRCRIIDVGFSAYYVMPVDTHLRRPHLSLCTVRGIDEFQSNWNLFTHGILAKLDDWSHIVAAGGSVLACLTPLHPTPSNMVLNEFYQSRAYGASDIDLFLWGLTADEARDKMSYIYEAVCAAAPWYVTCVRKPHVVSIHTTFPFRPVQIILRLYRSPAEILAGFDVDAACCIYDGTRVWVNPRSFAACIRQCNTIDITRRSPSYEMRLAKYAERGFEIYVPSLSRDNISPSLYDEELATFPNGLARLLVLEQLFQNPTTYNYLKYPKARGTLQNKNDVSDLQPPADEYQTSDYDLGWALIPYGLGWDAARIERLIDRKNCPAPDNAEEMEDVERESWKYIRGAVSFIVANPGRQLMTGSFNPIDTGEWEEEAYEAADLSNHSDGEQSELSQYTDAMSLLSDDD